MKICDKAYKLARRTKSTVDLYRAKALRQEVTRLLRQAKKEFILTQMNLARRDSRAFWNVINKAFMKSNQPVCKEVLDEKTGELVCG